MIVPWTRVELSGECRGRYPDDQRSMKLCGRRWRSGAGEWEGDNGEMLSFVSSGVAVKASQRDRRSNRQGEEAVVESECCRREVRPGGRQRTENGLQLLGHLADRG